ncbi:MAG: A24 family peptidase [Lachnospiraceae bacterium]|nr:A24 family peptidase [Lachnospiraceae bacterium]
MGKELLSLAVVFICGVGVYVLARKSNRYDILFVPAPWMELLHGLLYLLIFFIHGWNIISGLYCLMTTALVLLSLVDLKSYEIPPSLNLWILAFGIIHFFVNISLWRSWLIGFFAVSLPLYLLFLASDGRAIGGGDIKLMAVCGLMIGWKNILLALFLGCILGSVIHIARMKIRGADRVLAMGPYLAAGVYISMLFGEEWIQWYLSGF